MCRLAICRLPVLAFVGLIGLQPATVRSEDYAKAHLRAMGGEHALGKIKTLKRVAHVEGTNENNPFEGKNTELYDFVSDRGFSEVEISGYTREIGWDKDANWVKDNLTEARPMSPEEAFLYRYLGVPSPLLTLQAVYGAKELNLRGEKPFNGIQCNTLAIPGLSVEFHLDAKTNRLAGISMEGGGSVTYEDYLEFDGVIFAKQVRVHLPSLGTDVTSTYTLTHLNRKLDESKFKNPLDQASAKKPETSDLSKLSVNQLMLQLDKDKDGKISKEESTAEMQASFGYIDTNSDGGVDVQEATAMLAYVRSQASSNATASSMNGKSVPKQKVTGKQILDSMDQDGDQRLSRSEASEDLKLYFETYDVNQDKWIDAKEAEAIAKYVNGEGSGAKSGDADPRGYTAEQVISFLDKNGDQKVSLDEASPELKVGFPYVDTNGDGAIDLQEAKVMLQQYQR